jgi:dynein heavy chain, axonemal
MSPKPMNDISILLDEVYYPILNNPANQEGWPDIIKKDIDSHIQDLRNVIAEVSGGIGFTYAKLSNLEKHSECSTM